MWRGLLKTWSRSDCVSSGVNLPRRRAAGLLYSETPFGQYFYTFWAKRPNDPDRDILQTEAKGRLKRSTVNGLRLYSTFLTNGHSKCFKIFPIIHPFMHTFIHQRRSQPCKVTDSKPGAVRGRRLAQGHLDTQRGGAGDWTSNLQVTSSTSWARCHPPWVVVFLPVDNLFTLGADEVVPLWG